LQIEGLYTNPDGSFPNHLANPVDPKNLVDLQKLVTDQKLTAGVAFDGDGDRAFLVDEQSQIISASLLGCVMIEHFLKAHPGARIIYTPTVSKIVPETIAGLGGEAIVCRVGHSFIKAKMREVDAIFGLEEAGHFYFADNYRADSGLLAALCSLAILSQTQTPLSSLIAPYRKYHDSGELNFTVHDAPALLKAIWEKYGDGDASEIDGLTISYPDWCFNIRTSNTEPLVRLNIEANTTELLSSNTNSLIDFIKNY